MAKSDCVSVQLFNILSWRGVPFYWQKKTTLTHFSFVIFFFTIYLLFAWLLTGIGNVCVCIYHTFIHEAQAVACYINNNERKKNHSQLATWENEKSYRRADVM